MDHPGDRVHEMETDDIYTFFVSKIDGAKDILSAIFYWLPRVRNMAGDRRFKRMMNRMMTSPWPTLTNRIKIVELLIDGGLSVDMTDENQRTLLMLTAEPRIAESLLKAGADPNLRNEEGITALMMAQQPKMVKLLLRYGASPNLRCYKSYTALMWAGSRHPELGLVNALVEGGANIHLRDNKGESALFMTLKYFWRRPWKFDVNVLVKLGVFTVYPERTCIIQMIVRSSIDLHDVHVSRNIAALVKAGCVPTDADIDDLNLVCCTGFYVERHFSRNISPLYVAFYLNNWVIARLFLRASFFTPTDFFLALDPDLHRFLKGSPCQELFFQLPTRPFPLKLIAAERFNELLKPEEDREDRVKELETTHDLEYDLLYKAIDDFCRTYQKQVYQNHFKS